MRENIGLFRAKDIKTREWRKGYYWSNEVGNHFIRIVRDEYGDFINPFDYEVDHETICRFTGLLDKHGNKIFENDIVTMSNENYVIVWETAGFSHPEDSVDTFTPRIVEFESEIAQIEKDVLKIKSEIKLKEKEFKGR